MTWIGFERDAFELIAGAELLRWFASSPAAERGSCQVCGSNLLFRSERWPEEIHVALACIDDPVDRKPEANVFDAAHVAWMPRDETLPAIDPD